MNKRKMTFVRLVWHGRSHEAAGLSGCTKGGSTITIFKDQFPAGTAATIPRSDNSLSSSVRSACIQIHLGGYESICTKTVDLDEMETVKGK